MYARIDSPLSIGRLIATTGLLLAASLNCAGQGAGLCADTTISGELVSGQRFEASFADRLHFLLLPSRPPNPEGWTIGITGSDPAHDFLLVATPPYRFSNPRYLDTSYGHSADQAVAWNPRGFRFVVNEKDFSAMWEAIGILLWPAEATEEEIERAKSTVSDTPTAIGTLRILSAKTSDAKSHPPLGRIEELSFEARLCQSD